MGAGRTLGKLAAVGAAIAGVIFFWRKKHADKPAEAPTPPTASDTP